MTLRMGSKFLVYSMCPILFKEFLLRRTNLLNPGSSPACGSKKSNSQETLGRGLDVHGTHTRSTYCRDPPTSAPTALPHSLVSTGSPPCAVGSQRRPILTPRCTFKLLLLIQFPFLDVSPNPNYNYTFIILHIVSTQ